MNCCPTSSSAGTNHATLAGHEMMHELQVAIDAGTRIDRRLWVIIFWGGIRIQFPTNIYLTTECMLCILRMGGLTTGGVNFDAKVRR